MFATHVGIFKIVDRVHQAIVTIGCFGPVLLAVFSPECSENILLIPKMPKGCKRRFLFCATIAQPTACYGILLYLVINYSTSRSH